jgi:hypothetical protein
MSSAQRVRRLARIAALVGSSFMFGCSGGAADADAPAVRGTRDAAVPDDASGGDSRGGSASRPPVDGGSYKPMGGANGDAGPSGSPGSDAGLDCPPVSASQAPDALSCAGLYADIAHKDLAGDVQAFEPAYRLWSDGADKQRYISLPKGTQIDSRDPDSWKFPVGTKLFKEFAWKGQRVETRMFWKSAENRWLKAAYHWNADETEATRFAGGEVDVAGDKYYIPSAKECDQCHKGRADRALGFEQVLLSLPGATGLTLQKLIDDGLLTDVPSTIGDAIGDDGTGKAVDALAYLHVNCGVSCHNGNPASEGYSSDLRLRLPPDGIDGRAPDEFDSITTTVGVKAKTPRWSGLTRITPGSPENSLLYKLISTRDPANPKDQMPPIASRVVDKAGIAAVEAWIRSLPAP